MLNFTEVLDRHLLLGFMYGYRWIVIYFHCEVLFMSLQVIFIFSLVVMNFLLISATRYYRPRIVVKRYFMTKNRTHNSLNIGQVYYIICVLQQCRIFVFP
ncbi:hypothetical protein BDQ17DRAFT_1383537 [Cyathus striatus]|nr:hypothetical protein BDQ17DRAFT_1383537 [Cyathus striatus]